MREENKLPSKAQERNAMNLTNLEEKLNAAPHEIQRALAFTLQLYVDLTKDLNKEASKQTDEKTRQSR